MGIYKTLSKFFDTMKNKKNPFFILLGTPTFKKDL